MENTPGKVGEQAALAERLQEKWLQRMEKLLDNDQISATEMATLYRALRDNGWTFDPAQLPQQLKDKLTAKIDPTTLEDEDSVIPLHRKKA